LAAIAFADVVGWSRLVERDDVAAATAWKAVQVELIEPHMPAFGGRLIEVAGDAVLVEFSSAVEAVRWAIDLQQRLADRRAGDQNNPIRMRIGISIEDVIVDEHKLLGDGVNIASRVHQTASPDEVLVTQGVRDFVWNKLPILLDDLGEQHLKNISRPIRTYRVTPAASTSTGRPIQPHLMWENRPTVAVLPFSSGGSDADPYFGDGMTEEIITSLSMNRSLFVIARNSTLRYRGHRSSAADIAGELRVRYLLEGSVRRHGSRLRINAVLIDAGADREIWAEHYDGVDQDLFTFQDQIAASISAAIDPRVQEAEIARVRDRPTESFSAYDCVLRGLAVQYNFNDRDMALSGDMFRRAIELDPQYAQAHAHLAWWHNLRIGEGRSSNVGEDQQRAWEFSRRSIELDPRDAWALSVAGHIESFLNRRFAAALEMFDQALQLNPSCATAWALSAVTLAYIGRGEEALTRVRNALRLSPFDLLSFWFCTTNGIASIVAGRYDEAVSWLSKARRLNPRYRAASRMLIAILGLSGDVTQARELAREFLDDEPGFTVSGFGAWYPLQPPHLERVLEGLRLAGIPP
jgi:TolB-like protein/class 3 adenylate cyclase/Tfp pilus assembly protein PilF